MFYIHPLLPSLTSSPRIFIQRCEELQHEIDAVRKGCLQYVPRHVSEETYIDIYFYLKSKMATQNGGGSGGGGGGSSLAATYVADDMYGFVFSRIGPEHSELVPAMLRLIVLEVETEEVKRKIHGMIPQTPR